MRYPVRLVVGVAVATLCLVLAACSNATVDPSEETHVSDSGAESVRRPVDTEADLHVDKPEFSLDLPNYWLGKVDVVDTDFGGIVVYPRGISDCAVMSAGVHENAVIEGGDIGSGVYCSISLGNGNSLVFFTTRYPVLVCGKEDWREHRSNLYSPDGIEAAIDLQTGGQLSADAASMKDKNDVEEMVRMVNHYLNASILPGLVVHREQLPGDSSAGVNGIGVDADSALLDARYEAPGGYSIELRSDGTCTMDQSYGKSYQGEYVFDPSVGKYFISYYGNYDSYSEFSFDVKGQDIVVGGQIYHRVGMSE